MTVTSTTNRNDHIGTGALSEYPYTFRIFSDSDLLVTVRDTDDEETTLVLDTDYTVNGAGDAGGGTIDLIDAGQSWLDDDGELLADYAIVLRRVRPLTQQTDIRNQGSFFPETHEDTFDHLLMVSQQINEENGRAVKNPETVPVSTFNPTLPTDIASSEGQALIVNEAGDGFAMGPTADQIAAAQAYAETAEEWALLATTPFTLATNYGDGSKTDETIQAAVTAIGSTKRLLLLTPGTWVLNSNLTIPSNITLWCLNGVDLGITTGNTLTINGDIQAAKFQIFSGLGTVAGAIRNNELHPEWWGAVTDGSTDNTATLQKIITNVTSDSTIVVPYNCVYQDDIDWRGKKHRDLNRPFLINTVVVPSGSTNAGMYADDAYLYLCEYTNEKVRVFDLADRSNPVSIGTVTTASQPRSCYLVNKRFLFVACHGAARIQVWDVVIPVPALIGYITTAANPKDFLIIDNYIYVVCAGTSVVEKYLINYLSGSLVSTSFVASVSVGTTPLSLAYNGSGILAVCGLNNSLTIIGTDSLNVTATLTMPGTLHSFCAFSGNTLYVSDINQNRIYVVNMSDPLTPVLGTYIASAIAPNQLTIVGNRMYVPSLDTSGAFGTLDCIDIEKRRAPRIYKNLTLDIKQTAFTAVSGNYLYVNGHASPCNIDVVKIEDGDLPNKKFEAFFQSALINSNVFNFDYVTKIDNYTAVLADTIVRVSLAKTITIPDPATMPDGKMLVIANVSAADTSRVSSAYSGYAGYLAPGESVMLMASTYSGTSQWDVIGYGSGIRFANKLAPSQIMTNLNNYNPTGLAAASVLRLTSDASRTITGIATGADGRTLLIYNYGAQDIVLANASASSTAANRILTGTGSDITMTPGMSKMLVYELGGTNWRVIG